MRKLNNSPSNDAAHVSFNEHRTRQWISTSINHTIIKRGGLLGTPNRILTHEKLNNWIDSGIQLSLKSLVIRMQNVPRPLACAIHLPPILCPTQWNLLASKPSRNNFISDLPASLEMMDERMTALWRMLNEYWPQSRITRLWSFRLMYDSLTSWGPSDPKSSIHPGSATRALNFQSTRKSFDSSTK